MSSRLKQVLGQLHVRWPCYLPFFSLSTQHGHTIVATLCSNVLFAWWGVDQLLYHTECISKCTLSPPHTESTVYPSPTNTTMPRNIKTISCTRGRKFLQRFNSGTDEKVRGNKARMNKTIESQCALIAVELFI